MDVHRLLRRWNIRASKGLGQNFLWDATVLEKIADAAHLTPEDIVLEVGPGLGNLTQFLAERAGHVVAVELDERFFPVLEGALIDFDNVTLVQGDILQLNPSALVEDVAQARPEFEPRYKVVANLPYYITSAILRHFLESERRPEEMVVTVQYEVAKRITQSPGDLSLLAISVQFYGDPEIVFRIKAGSFVPAPDVDSALLRIDVRDSLPIPEERVDDFFRVVQAGFSQRRKQLRNSLSAGLQVSADEVEERMAEAGVDHRRRPQTLSVEEWIAVARAFWAE